jgi:putative ABC transport system permease protein
MKLELGPILRAISRRKSAFALIVLELASGFTIICSLMLAGSWYQKVGTVRSSDSDEALLEVVLYQPLATSDAAAALREAQRWQGEALALLAATPGVQAVAPVSTSLLDERIGMPSLLRVKDSATVAAGWTVQAGPSLPEVLGLRLVDGKPFAEVPPAARVGGVVITRCLRDHLFPRGQSGIGHHLVSGEMADAPIIAVVEDVYMRRPFMAETQCQPFFFAPASDERNVRYLLRTPPAGRAALVMALSGALAVRYPQATITVKPYTFENARHYTITHGILIMLIVMAFNVGALALLGPLAVSSFLVAERTRQIGVRRALGATRGDIIRYFLVENAMAVALGTGLGAAITSIFVALMRGAFFSLGLTGWHLALAAVLLWIDGTIAALVPALRAARIAPSVAAKSR